MVSFLWEFTSHRLEKQLIRKYWVQARTQGGGGVLGG